MIPGGLTNLLDAVGHVEEEIRVGALASTRQSLGDAVEHDPEGQRSFAWGCPSDPYFGFVGCPDQARLEAALDAFPGLEARARAFRGEYRERVNRALDEGFGNPLVIPRRVGRSFRYLPELVGVADYLIGLWQAGGPPPQITFGGPTPVPGEQGGRGPDDGARRDGPNPPGGQEGLPKGENVFRRSGSGWIVRYGELTEFFTAADGFFYIARLLVRPDQGFAAGELRAALVRFSAGPGDPVHSKMDEETLGGEGLGYGAGDLGEVFDDDAEKAYRRRGAKLGGEIQKARKAGDQASVTALEAEKQTLDAELRRGLKLHGGARKVSACIKKDRDAVRNAINRSLDQIKKKIPGLGLHFRKSLKYTPLFCYSPGQPTDWQL
jgi:hypothetical protein